MKRSLPAHPVLLPCPALVIGTYDPRGRPNLMLAAWGGIASSKPPCISVSLRAATLTHQNIKQSRAFTANIPSEKHVAEADFFGMVSGRERDKFEAACLTAEKSKLVAAPFVKEFPYALECTVVNELELGSHTMFIGEIVGMVADDTVLGEHQLPDIEKVRPILWGSFGRMAYYNIGTRIGDTFSVGRTLLDAAI